MAKELSIADKANKENWRILKHSNEVYSCECLCDGEYVTVCFRRNLPLAKSEVDSIIYDSSKKLKGNTLPEVILDYSVKPVEVVAKIEEPIKE